MPDSAGALATDHAGADRCVRNASVAEQRAIDALRPSSRQAAHISSTAATDTPENRRATAVTETPSDPGVLADTRKAVREALKSLPDQQRIPLEMAYFEGMTHTEIAETLNQPLGTMKDRIRTGMSHLRRQLKAYL